MLLLPLLLAAAVAGEGGPHDVAAYLRLGVAYRSRGSPVVDAMLGWTGAEIGDAQRRLRSREGVLRARASSPDEIDLRVVEAIALLHLEAGVKALQETNEATGRIQLSAASDLARWTQEAAARRAREHGLPEERQLNPRLGRAALHATAAEAALAVGFPEIARAEGEAAREAEPTDPGVLLALATALDGAAHLQAAEGRATDARATRERAIRAFEDVLAVNPAALEARLRLGGLLGAEGRFVEAEPLLEQAASDGTPRQRYLARLFQALVAERRKDWPAAFRAYSEALEAVPDGTAARLGLALALERQAGEAAARTAVMAALSRADRLTAPTDPWSNYPFGDVEATAEDMKRLWARVLAP